MIRRPPITTRADTLFPYTTLFRSLLMQRYLQLGVAGEFALLDVVQLERRRHRGRCRRTIGGNGQGAGLGLGLRSGKERHLRISYTGLPGTLAIRGSSRSSARCPLAARASLILVIDLKALLRRRTASREKPWSRASLTVR